MKMLSRTLAAAALALAGVSAQAGPVIDIVNANLTGNLDIRGFGTQNNPDNNPLTYTVSLRGANGSLVLRNAPTGSYEISVSGGATFVGCDPSIPTCTISGNLAMPLLLFSGFLQNSGLALPVYPFSFNTTDPVTTIGTTPAFSTSYDGRTTQAVLDQLNALLPLLPGPPLPPFVDPTGAGTLTVTGTLYSDGFEFNVTETANWACIGPGDVCGGFGAILAAIDGFGGGANGIIDGQLTLENFRVTAVPEPATLALVGLGLLGAAAARRRRA